MKEPNAILKLVLLVLFSSAPMHAQQIHKWTDEDGNVHYGTVPPTETPSDVVTVDQQNFSTPDDALDISAEQSISESREERQKKKAQDRVDKEAENIRRLKAENNDPVKCDEQKAIMESLKNSMKIPSTAETNPQYLYHKNLARFYCD